MDDLISRAEAIVEIDEYLYGLDLCISEPDLKLDGYNNGLQVAIQELKALPAVDAVLVMHGEWKWSHGGECSECGFHNSNFDYRYCPMCGARMDG